MDSVVVDTNILFSSLLRSPSSFAQTIVGSGHSFFVCESTIVELFKHKERIVKLSQLGEDEVVRVFYLLLRHVTVSKEVLIPPDVRQQAYRLCKEVDVGDSPHVALTLHLKGRLWTGDKKLKAGLHEKGFDRFYEP